MQDEEIRQCKMCENYLISLGAHLCKATQFTRSIAYMRHYTSPCGTDMLLYQPNIESENDSE